MITYLLYIHRLKYSLVSISPLLLRGFFFMSEFISYSLFVLATPLANIFSWIIIYFIYSTHLFAQIGHWVVQQCEQAEYKEEG